MNDIPCELIRFSPAPLPLAVVGALAILATAAASQQIAESVGSSIPFRVGLPTGAEISRDGDFIVAETRNMHVVAAAVDMMPAHGDVLPVSDGEARRILTSVFTGSDSLMIGLLLQSLQERNLAVGDVVTEMRTLGGQRSGYLQGGFNENGTKGWVEAHLTVKDGIMYILMIAGRGRAPAPGQGLASRIHSSFVLADAPPAPSPPVEGAQPGRVIRKRAPGSR